MENENRTQNFYFYFLLHEIFNYGIDIRKCIVEIEASWLRALSCRFSLEALILGHLLDLKWLHKNFRMLRSLLNLTPEQNRPCFVAYIASLSSVMSLNERH